MLASLPMYDLPEVKAATDGFWRAIAGELGQEAVSLTRAADWSAPWRDPALLFSQTCGYPFTHAFAGMLTYVATPHYAADGCEGPNYRSLVFAREAKPLSAFRNSRAAFNNKDSMSGMLALKLVFAPLAEGGRFFKNAIETGSHIASLAAVQSGTADVCAIDCVTVALLRRHRPSALESLCEIARSPAVPGLPFVTRTGPVHTLQAALQSAVASADNKPIRDALLLTGVSVLEANAYNVILNLEARLQYDGELVLPAPV